MWPRSAIFPRFITTSPFPSWPVLNIPQASVYRFGDSIASKPVFTDLKWTIEDGENWAIVGSASKTPLIEVSPGISDAMKVDY